MAIPTLRTFCLKSSDIFMWCKCTCLYVFSVCLPCAHIFQHDWVLVYMKDNGKYLMSLSITWTPIFFEVVSFTVPIAHWPARIGFFYLHLRNNEKSVTCCHDQLFHISSGNRVSGPHAGSHTSIIPTETISGP